MLLPYYGELIHYDAVERHVQGDMDDLIERYTSEALAGSLTRYFGQTPIKPVGRRTASALLGSFRFEFASRPSALALQAHDFAKPKRNLRSAI